MLGTVIRRIPQQATQSLAAAGLLPLILKLEGHYCTLITALPFALPVST